MKGVDGKRLPVEYFFQFSSLPTFLKLSCSKVICYSVVLLRGISEPQTEDTCNWKNSGFGKKQKTCTLLDIFPIFCVNRVGN